MGLGGDAQGCGGFRLAVKVRERGSGGSVCMGVGFLVHCWGKGAVFTRRVLEKGLKEAVGRLM